MIRRNAQTILLHDDIGMRIQFDHTGDFVRYV